MEEKGIDRNEVRAVLRLSNAAKEAGKADRKFNLLLYRWAYRHKEFFQKVFNDRNERRKLQRILNTV